jgi:short subunit dehydrogenase-like uncharacterized protein
MTDGDRPFDVVLWGATGFTGRLTAEYLTRNHGVGAALRWAIGGRSRDKLERVRDGLAAIDPGARELPLLLGDGGDRASLDALARQTKVVLSTVGPFSLHGRELVAACVEAGTDYCDSTGEPQFVRAMIDAHHERARMTGARIVHCCGFDSVPSDLGTLMVQAYARDEHGSACSEVRHYVSLRGGGLSGGTVASMVALMDEASKDDRVRKLLANPYSLDPDRGDRGPDGHDPRGVAWDEDLQRWTGPFVMAAINSRVVRRSNALLGYAWGRDFRYREGMSFRSGPQGWMKAATMSVGVAAAFGIMAVPPLRRVIARRLPAPGEGPSKEQRDRSSFVSRFVGVLEGSGGRVRGEVKGVGDPGYDETAKMLGESALCLARDRDSTRTEGGVLTPASCLGMTLIDRLRKAGMTFDVQSTAVREDRAPPSR